MLLLSALRTVRSVSPPRHPMLFTAMYCGSSCNLTACRQLFVIMRRILALRRTFHSFVLAAHADALIEPRGAVCYFWTRVERKNRSTRRFLRRSGDGLIFHYEFINACLEGDHRRSLRVSACDPCTNSLQRVCLHFSCSFFSGESVQEMSAT